MGQKNDYKATIDRIDKLERASSPVQWVIRKEAAEILGVDVRTFRRWERSAETPFGDFPYCQHRYFRRSDIEKLALVRRQLKSERLSKRGGSAKPIRIPLMLKKGGV